MIRYLALSALLACLAFSPVNAGPIEDSIVRQLREQGFGDIEVRRTLLGRSRIVAQSDTLYREIIVNPVTGEILRDYWRPFEEREGGSGTIFDPTSGRGDSGSGDDDDDDDDREDDRDDDGDSDGDSDGGDGGDDD